MIVAEILRTKGHRVVTVAPTATVAEAAALLERNRIGAAVVSADGRRLDGLLDESDIVRAVVRDGPEGLNRPVRDAMTREPATCAPDDRITSVMAVMTQRRQRHLPVLSGGELAGLVSIGDAVKARLSELELEARVLRDAWIAHRA